MSSMLITRMRSLPTPTTKPTTTNLPNKAPVTGRIVAVRQFMAEVEFSHGFPRIHELLSATHRSGSILLEVLASSSPTRMYCLMLTATPLPAGIEVTSTGKTLEVPVGSSVLGRAIDVFGEPQDGLESNFTEKRSIYQENVPSLEHTPLTNKVMLTGIKAIDFFAPLIVGGKMGLLGGAGLGKTILLTELIHNIVIAGDSAETKEAVCVFSAVGERSREAHELLGNVKESGVLDRTVMVIGQMGENPAVRFRTAFAAATEAEYFRDQGKDVLFFIDNMFRFSQAGYELSTATNAIPSEDGYQPTLPSEVGGLHERLVSSPQGDITTIEAVYLPSDDITDYSVRSIFPYLDSFLVLSRDVYQQGRLPAVDLLGSSSAAMTPDIVGAKHYQLYLEAKKTLSAASRLERIVSLIGLSELSKQDQLTFTRATRIKNFMTQRFFVASSQTGERGEQAQLSQTLEVVERIISGNFDEVDPQEFLYARADHLTAR